MGCDFLSRNGRAEATYVLRQSAGRDPSAPMQEIAFKDLFEEHADFVARALRRHGVPERELDDACQEVFLVAFRRLSEFEDRSTLRTWFYGIAIRIASGLRRRAFRWRESLSERLPEPVVEADAFDAYAQTQERQLLQAALTRLARDNREIFVLYELEGMTLDEVAAAIGVPANTARYRLYAARSEVLAFVRKLEGGSAQPSGTGCRKGWEWPSRRNHSGERVLKKGAAT